MRNEDLWSLENEWVNFKLELELNENNLFPMNELVHSSKMN